MCAERGEDADLPKLDDFHCHKQRDGHEVGVQDPEGDQVDEELRRIAGVVALHTQHRSKMLARNPREEHLSLSMMKRCDTLLS